ncbi:non-canonical purine NTP diphosphatase [Xanthovirga aplysinae]|uniref:non-canonical purine NTP diphosphatase n=1 Tax=Xanthovirga aplysinae TaxID=2529853 RepID=UPI0012BD7C88|nr:non-canonical purine NTP diphosphatase [Xanthovirga aplysinae]MTI32408.1 non-canonical purine NTP diphosphatase [Xanthovirga aplysinae]
MKICFATNNLNKLKEIQTQLGEDFELLSLSDIGCEEELPENQQTLEGNSREKALYVANKYNVSCFADDTGLEVDSLGGEPGVYSARYAGLQRSNDDNIALLLEKLKPFKDRSAQFRTVITLILNGKEVQFEGVAKGKITKEIKGNGGFGYDPVFQPFGHERTFAEMSLKEKNQISHRGKAVEKLVVYLKQEV